MLNILYTHLCLFSSFVNKWQKSPITIDNSFFDSIKSIQLCVYITCLSIEAFHFAAHFDWISIWLKHILKRVCVSVCVTQLKRERFFRIKIKSVKNKCVKISIYQMKNHFNSKITSKLKAKYNMRAFGKIIMRAQKNRNAKKSLQIWIYWFFVREMKYQLFSTKTYCLLTGLESSENKHWETCQSLGRNRRNIIVIFHHLYRMIDFCMMNPK